MVGSRGLRFDNCGVLQAIGSGIKSLKLCYPIIVH